MGSFLQAFEVVDRNQQLQVAQTRFGRQAGEQDERRVDVGGQFKLPIVEADGSRRGRRVPTP
jgi:hypothetical protein